jgi:hypothetical protein
MTEQFKKPKVKPGGIVTVSYLKAQLDSRSDHLGIFMPLVLDVIARCPDNSFTAASIQELLAKQHGLAMPQNVVTTLLMRATRAKTIDRSLGLFHKNKGRQQIRVDIDKQKSLIQESQMQLAKSLRKFATSRGLEINTDSSALDILLKFLENEQISLLLNDVIPLKDVAHKANKERTVVAEFLQFIVREDPVLRVVLNDILAGLVLYQAAFLPDFSAKPRNFNNLVVAFDSVLIRQALGYEGIAMRALLREVLDVLRANGVRCIVFDKTVQEIRRILLMYEQHLGTDRGRRSLRPVPMARHLLTNRYSPSDVRQLSALLEKDISSAGFQVQKVPTHVADYTAGEKALAQILADPKTRDEQEPRVQHDVDCVAAVLTLRRGQRSAFIEDARAVFATSSPLVLKNVKKWYFEDEHDSGVEPVVHIRALTNLAWLKKPTLCNKYKEIEIVSLCSAALRPTQETWQRFLRHLEALEKSQKASSDEITAILISAMSDQLLKEFEDETAEDPDVSTLDEVYERVKETYSAAAEEKIREASSSFEGRLREHEVTTAARIKEISDKYEFRLMEAEKRGAQALADVERMRRHDLNTERRANRVARGLNIVFQVFVGVFVVVGAIAIISIHRFTWGIVEIVLSVSVIIFVALEIFGIFKHLKSIGQKIEVCANRRLRRWLKGESL